MLTPVKASGWFKSGFTTDELSYCLKSGIVPVNDIFYKLWDDESLLKMLFGGFGSGKSDFIATWHVKECEKQQYFKGFFGRKVEGDARESCHSKIISIIERHGLQADFKYSKEPTGTMVIQHRKTGNVLMPFGAQDANQMKSVDDPSSIWMEEGDQFTDDDMRILLSRLRTPKSKHTLWLSFNTSSVTPEHWIIKYFFPDLSIYGEAKENEKLADALQAISVTKVFCNYNDNFFLDKEEYFKVLNFLAGGDQAILDAIAAGAWGVMRKGGEFWKDFDVSKHTTSTGWNKALPLHITWDENVNPFLTCLIWQIVGSEIIQIDEICLEDPKNRVKDVCAEFMRRYPVSEVRGLFVYGDRTSIKEDTKLEKGENFFTKILEHLQFCRPRLRMQSVNPSVVQSGSFINAIYAGIITDITIRINSRCKKSIYDYQYAPEDSDGTLKKVKKTNPVTKVTYEVFGHPSDAKRYFITTAFADQYHKYLNQRKNKIADFAGAFR
jgi:phage terminase large subunit